MQQSLRQLPAHGSVRLAIDWTIEGDQHLLVVSLIIGRRAIPVYWRAYEASVLKGRRTRYEQAVIKRVLTRLLKCVQPGRLIVRADRGFADVDLCDLLDSFKIAYVLRVKCSTKVYWAQTWCSLSQIGFVGNSRHRDLGRILYCASSPHRLWLTLSRQRDKLGKWEVWYLLSNRKRSAAQMADEYAHRMGCDEGFRDAKWWLGFAKARITLPSARAPPPPLAAFSPPCRRFSGSVPLTGPKPVWACHGVIHHMFLGGTRKLSNSSIVQMWSVNPAAMAGVRSRHFLGEPCKPLVGMGCASRWRKPRWGMTK